MSHQETIYNSMKNLSKVTDDAYVAVRVLVAECDSSLTVQLAMNNIDDRVFGGKITQLQSALTNAKRALEEITAKKTEIDQAIDWLVCEFFKSK